MGPAASPRSRVAQSALAQRGAAAAGEGGGGGDGGVRGPSEGLLVAEILVDGGGGGGKPGRRRGARDVDTVAVAVPVVIVGLGSARPRPRCGLGVGARVGGGGGGPLLADAAGRQLLLPPEAGGAGVGHRTPRREVPRQAPVVLLLLVLRIRFILELHLLPLGLAALDGAALALGHPLLAALRADLLLLLLRLRQRVRRQGVPLGGLLQALRALVQRQAALLADSGEGVEHGLLGAVGADPRLLGEGREDLPLAVLALPVHELAAVAAHAAVHRHEHLVRRQVVLAVAHVLIGVVILVHRSLEPLRHRDTRTRKKTRVPSSTIPYAEVSMGAGRRVGGV